VALQAVADIDFPAAFPMLFADAGRLQMLHESAGRRPDHDEGISAIAFVADTLQHIDADRSGMAVGGFKDACGVHVEGSVSFLLCGLDLGHLENVVKRV